MSIRLQERDQYLLRLLVKDFLLLSREQIQQLIPRGVRRTNQRLAKLIKYKLLEGREPKTSEIPICDICTSSMRSTSSSARTRKKSISSSGGRRTTTPTGIKRARFCCGRTATSGSGCAAVTSATSWRSIAGQSGAQPS